MTFPYNVYLAATLSAAAVAFFSLPLWRKWCLATGLVDDPGERKIHDQTIPLAGGLAVMTGLLVPALLGSVALWWQGSHAATPPGSYLTLRLAPLDQSVESLLLYGLNRRAVELTGIFLGALGMLAVGWLDDKRELRPAAKFGGQLAVALLVSASGARITLFVPNIVFSHAVTILWLLTIINAFNFVDNMNGLCAGLGASGSWFFALAAAAGGQYLVALIAFLTFGALLGFLPHNFPRARAFLGDAGSHLVGYLLAVLAILPHFYTPEHPRHRAVLIPLFVLALPLIDLAWVVLFRWRRGLPVYVGDNNHLSHQLVRQGFSRTLAVLMLWLAAALLGGMGCWLLM